MTDNGVLCIYLPEPYDAASNVRWYTGNPDGGEDMVNAEDLENTEYRGSWNHWAFTKNSHTGEMTVYYNGDPCEGVNNSLKEMYGAINFRIGSKVDEEGGNHYYVFGRVDDFRIYDYVLSEADIQRLANQQQLQDQRGDYDSSGRINFNDLAEFGKAWLEEQLWP